MPGSILPALSGIEIPAGYSISHEGEIKQMKESFGRLGQALMLGLVLLYFSLVPAFRSWVHPLTIMSAIPLALIGASWGLLIVGKHGCMPSMMGMILLAGVVVKNSILLIDFIAELAGTLVEFLGRRLRSAFWFLPTQGKQPR